jgi:RNA methyltransferase, TrmH family
MRILVIASPTNQTIKDLTRLKDRKGDRAERSFVVEGRREIQRAVTSGFVMEDFFYCPDELDVEGRSLVEQVISQRKAEVSREAFAKVATREGSDGLLAVFALKSATFSDILARAGKTPVFIVVVEDIEKPGNLGAVLRSADAAGVHGVVTLGKTVDTWNSNAIRSSLGGLFSVPVVNAGTKEFFDWCASQGVKLIGAALSEQSKSIYDSDFRGPVAILFGSEAFGLSPLAMSHMDEAAMIPMQGVCDSLNISVAAGIFMYEVLRQRRAQ